MLLRMHPLTNRKWLWL